jgi:hypothetical protein
MTGHAVLRLICLAGLLLGAAPVLAAAQDLCASKDPYWPSERAERLEEIGVLVKDLLEQSSRARYLGHLAEQEQILQEIRDLQGEAERLREAPVHTTATR